MTNFMSTEIVAGCAFNFNVYIFFLPFLHSGFYWDGVSLQLYKGCMLSSMAQDSGSWPMFFVWNRALVFHKRKWCFTVAHLWLQPHHSIKFLWRIATKSVPVSNWYVKSDLWMHHKGFTSIAVFKEITSLLIPFAIIIIIIISCSCHPKLRGQ